MEFMKLVADGMKFLLELPIRLIRSIGKWKMFRGMATRGIGDVGRELQPVSGASKFLRATGWVLRWLLVVLIIGVVFAVLGYLNYALDLERMVGGPWPLVRRIWLPFLFFLFCVVCALGWWLWKLLGPERDTAEFPDILEAWDEARAALEQAGIALTDAPLFLVLGRPEGPLDAVFNASQVPFVVRQAPRRANAPLQVYATREAIYLCCPGVSLLGKQVGILTGEVGVDSVSARPASRVESVFADIEADEPVVAAASTPGTAAVAPPTGLLELTPGFETSTESATAALATEDLLPSPQPQRRRQPLVNNQEEVDRATARLRYLCGLVARDRRPYCPANGCLVLLPFAGLAADEDAAETATAGRIDLLTVRQALRLEFPVFTLVCDLQRAPGARQLLDAIPSERRQRLLGQSWPLAPDVPAAELPKMIDGGVSWICQALALLIYRLLRLDSPGQEHVRVASAANRRLYQFLGALQNRQLRLSRLLTRLAGYEDGNRLLLGGCYFGATGMDADREQAFVGGVFQRLIDNQNYVSWTDEALAEEADARRWTVYGYFIIGIFTVVVAALTYLRWRGGLGR